MAVRLVKSGTLILTPPKVGGTWIRLALASAGVAWVEEGPLEAGGQGGLETHPRDGSFMATFVREPVAWYQSYWAYRMEGSWRTRFDLDRICAADDFDIFIRRVVSELPGFLTAMFERYVGPSDRPIDFVGRQENLAGDLATLLRGRGEAFDAAALRNTPRANATTLRPDIKPHSIDAIHVSEQEMAQRFGYSWPDPLGLVAAQMRYPADAETLRRLVLWTERTHWQPDDGKRAAGDPGVNAVRQARCRSNFALFAQFMKDDVPYARACFEEALRLAPNHPRTLANFAALKADELNDAEGAEQLFRKALEGRPGHVHSLGLFSRFLERCGRSDEAAGFRQRLAGLGVEKESLQGAANLLIEEP
jgi:tetratricopeptide (TPR) repeat protein